MIEINLVPEELRKKRKKSSTDKSPVPLEIIIGIGGGFLVLLFLIHVGLSLFFMGQKIKNGQLEVQWQKLLPDKERVDVVTSEIRALENKKAQMQTVLLSNNILWAKKLNRISDDLPKGVWLRKVSLDHKVFLIEGSAVARQYEEMINVHAFMTNLKNDIEFVKYFNEIEIGSMQRRKINEVEIADFVITIAIKDENKT